MIVITRKLISIDDEVSASDLIDSWNNGNKSDVLDKLANDHAGLTAMVLVTGATDKRLSLAACNEITNKLIDRRRDLMLASE
jgi:hypothetical protein